MLPLKEDDILEAYKRVVTRFSRDLADVIDVVKESIDEELKIENIADLTPVQEKLTETRKQILENYSKIKKVMRLQPKNATKNMMNYQRQ